MVRPPMGGEEQVDVWAGQQLRMHNVGLLEEGLSTDPAESLSNAGKCPQARWQSWLLQGIGHLLQGQVCREGVLTGKSM